LATVSGADTAGLPAISWQIGAAKEELPQLPNRQLPTAKCQVQCQIAETFLATKREALEHKISTQKTKDLRHELAEMAG